MKTEKKLVLYNKTGNVVRVFPWVKNESFWAIFRKDIKKLEIVSNLELLKKEKVSFETLASGSGEQLLKTPLKIGSFGKLELTSVDDINPILDVQPEDQTSAHQRTILLSLFSYLLLGFLLSHVFVSEEISETLKEEKKREVVKIVRKKLNIPLVSKERQTMVFGQRSSKQKTTSKKTSVSWKKRGALAALGQLKKGTQKGGGLDLGTVESTTGSGPGLGGSEGSGGVQTSIYGKGLVAAPLGTGGRVSGGGGYGTKGKGGGGKAGYGNLSLVGSTSSSLIPVPEEAFFDEGIDKSLILKVVNRNKGQLRFCYEQGLQTDSSLNGLVTISWIIDSNGHVKTAKIKKTALKNKFIEDCMIRRLKTWKFSIPKNSRDISVSFPFMFSPNKKSKKNS